MHYCEWKVKGLKQYAHGRRLLDLVDLHMMDYLIGNQVCVSPIQIFIPQKWVMKITENTHFSTFRTDIIMRHSTFLETTFPRTQFTWTMEDRKLDLKK